MADCPVSLGILLGRTGTGTGSKRTGRRLLRARRAAPPSPSPVQGRARPAPAAGPAPPGEACPSGPRSAFRPDTPKFF
ncbi:hypothetical protein RGUI_4328 (plasmid) [Rhodovulum sp. P5]|nr:hypothetical protein RGUI_4328 [Rhodovulum sp. P5]